MNIQLKNIFKLAPIFMLVVIGFVGCREAAVEEPTSTPPTTPAALATATMPPTATPLYRPVFETADCAFQPPGSAEIECGYLIVPEDRTDPERMIRLHVALISSNRADPTPDPVVYLNGGPGAHTLDNIAVLVQTFQPILRDRDLIVFDQRGIGYSEPSLNCPEVEEAFYEHLEEQLDLEAQEALVNEVVSACRDRLLAEGINLAAYNSAAGAADLDDLRRVLGYESWNLFGVSYGSRLALTTMRDFASTGAIRSVVLDSVYPPQIDGPGLLAWDADRAFDLLFERCRAIEQCNEKYPDLENRFYQLVDDLNADPIDVVVPDRVNRGTYRIPFTGDYLIEAVFDMMYDDRAIINIPKMISQLENGVSMILTNFLAGNIYEPLWISEGMGRSVQCYEEVPFSISLEEQVGSADLPEQLFDFYQAGENSFKQQCQLWLDETADPIENEAVVSDIPTLLLAGDYDPITPPSFAQETAETLSNSYYYEFLGIGHGVAFSNDCGLEIIVDFLSQPDTAPDDSCLEHLFIGFVP